jgi:hypothetical protein
MANVRSIAGQSIHLRSGRVVHACEGAELAPGTFVLWTLCGMDVAAGTAHLAHARERVTCRACARLATAPPANDEAPPQSRASSRSGSIRRTGPARSRLG